jgi:propionyl-CoA synthetase
MNFCMRSKFGAKGPGDVVFAASDIGWVFGHSFIVYGPLLAGAATVLFEGKPIGTPDAGIFWRIVSEYKVSMLCTAPSALRAIRSHDSGDRLFKQMGAAGALRSLRAIFLAGERSEPNLVQLYSAYLQKYSASPSLVIDNWWSTETGSPITGTALGSFLISGTDANIRPGPVPVRVGSAGKPVPGYDVRVVNEEGQEVRRGIPGSIVLGLPLAPTAMTTLWNDEERFYKSYLARFNGRLFDTGDQGLIDEDGYVHILSRSDDVINVAAHRLSSGDSKSSLLSILSASSDIFQ